MKKGRQDRIAETLTVKVLFSLLLKIYKYMRMKVRREGE